MAETGGLAAPRGEPSGLLALAQHPLGDAEAIDADRNTAIDRNLGEHRPDLVGGEPVAQRTAHVGLEFFHLAERGDHAEVEDRALARAERIVAPSLAPAVLGDDALEISVEVVGALERAIDVFFAEHLAPHGQAAVIDVLVHRHSSVLRSRPLSAASRVSVAVWGKATPRIAA